MEREICSFLNGKWNFVVQLLTKKIQDVGILGCAGSWCIFVFICCHGWGKG